MTETPTYHYFSLYFPSGAAVVCEGEKIVGRTEPESRGARFERLADKLEDMVANDEGLLLRLREMRGGCSCHISPPCSACCSPLIECEADELGLLDDEEPAPEPKRPALPHYKQRTPYDAFADWQVYSDAVSCGFIASEPVTNTHPLQRLNESSPFNASAHLLKTA